MGGIYIVTHLRLLTGGPQQHERET